MGDINDTGKEAADRLRLQLSVPQSPMCGETYVLNPQDIEIVLRDHSRLHAALEACHREIFKLRDALASQPVGAAQ